MDDIQHPLEASVPSAKSIATSSNAQAKSQPDRDSSGIATVRHGKAVPDSRALRNRSKSLTFDPFGWNTMPPRLSVDHTTDIPTPYPRGTAKTKSWAPTLERAIKAIVSISATSVRYFDTENAGFIVDAARGIILTNRHVVSPGPIVAQAVLNNYEEVDLQPVYRDPVHDFGFMKFDPAKVKFMELVAIELSPERAKVGLDIRVVGAPNYGVGNYNDFNTFYLQAASGTSGGSSGSPVLDIDGHAVALNAGGSSNAASSYYLPLDRVKRALAFIQDGKPVPRGTLQTEFEYLPYNEVRRLGLKASIEEKVRRTFPNETGMLVVRSLLPKGPSDGKLAPGDIIIECNGQMVPHFIALFSILDDAVDQEVTLKISRGNKVITVNVRVQCLHSITPDRFVEIGGGIVHSLSYQLARSYTQPVEGVYVATYGHMLGSAYAWQKSIILSVNNIPTPDLDAFIKAIQTLPDGASVPIRTYKENVYTMHVDRHWYPFRLAIRNDQTGLWDFTDMPPPPTQKLLQGPVTAAFPQLDPSMVLAEKLMPSFVKIKFYPPHYIDGLRSSRFIGTGFILSTSPPLIMCDRDTVPISLGDIYITFADSITISGKLLLLHPFYNYGFITYDPALIGETPVRAIEFSDVELSQGDETHFVGVRDDHTAVLKKSSVSSISDIYTRGCSPPRWRSINTEMITIDDAPDCQGVLTDSEGKVEAFWLDDVSQNDDGKDSTFRCGLSSSLIRPTLDKVVKGENLVFRGLDVELWTMTIATARTQGLTNDWVHRIEKSGRTRHVLLYVLHILDKRSPCSKALKVGDIILTVNGNIATRMADMIPVHMGDQTHVEMVILRNGEELTVDVPLNEFSANETKRIVCWQGALLQPTYKSVLEKVKNVPSGVYISCTLYGSPAYKVLGARCWITEVQGTPVTDVDSFLKVVHAHEAEQCRRRSLCIPSSQKPSENVAPKDSKAEDTMQNVDKDEEDDTNDDGYIRLKTISYKEETCVKVVKLDLHYWDSWELVHSEESISGWVRRPA
ncbi:serine protease [Apophysomyces ossiformis]|uniref:Serine protease n=1 Tax=Apophysomyces ossiformis TaxID=679940 RepID=A0A8H7BPQ0_9FUNG|nr:serine protease [Apophysomyces ossiformis]